MVESVKGKHRMTWIGRMRIPFLAVSGSLILAACGQGDDAQKGAANTPPASRASLNPFRWEAPSR
jgi:hypothetical protein